MTGPEYTRANEGCKLKAYLDTRGIWTVGVGCTGPDIGPTTEWTQDHADAEFAHRYELAQQKAQVVVGTVTWLALNDVRKAILTDMAYQMGGAGLARFRNMLAAIRDQEWRKAADEMLDSDYAKQTPNRAERNAKMIVSGEWA